MQYLLFAGLALLSSAANTIFNRISANKISSVVSAVLKGFFIVLAIFGVCACLGHVPQLYSLTNEQWLWMGILGLVTSADWILYFLSIKRAHLEAFAPFEASAVLFLSNLLFSFFMFSSVTNNGSPLSTALFFLGLACLLGAMLFAVFNKKINPSTKKLWVIFAFFSALAMGFTLVITKTKLQGIEADVIAFHQMLVVFVVCTILMIFSKGYKELKTVKLLDYLKFFIAAIFNALLIFFRYKALLLTPNPAIVNCIISFDYVLVSLATVLFFKADNKKELIFLIIVITAGMTLNVVSGIV